MTHEVTSREPRAAHATRGPGLLARRRFWDEVGGGGIPARVWVGVDDPEAPGAPVGANAVVDPDKFLPPDAGTPVVALSRREADDPVLVGFGDPHRIGPLLDTLELPSLTAAFLPRWGDGERETGTDALRGAGLRHTRDWDWLWIDTPLPPVPLEHEVEELDVAGSPAVARAVRACLEEAVPGTSALTDLAAHRWFGIRETPGDDGSPVLSAVATDGPGGGEPRGAMHLAGFGTVPRLRGLGVGTALLAAVVRRGLAEGPLVHLGMWADNDAARRLYLRHGFRLDMRVEMWRRIGDVDR